jgi:hypothetical protein
MRFTNRKAAIVAAVLLVGGGLAAAGGVALATGGDDEELTGEARDRAVAAALAFTGGGTVTETEIGDDGAAFEVEVRLDDGRQVEVQLDASFTVIAGEPDDDGSDDDEADDD